MIHEVDDPELFAPACTIAAPPSAETPAAIIAGPNVAEAIVVPAVVEAVAAPIKIPAIGANKNSGILKLLKRAIVSTCTVEAFIIPATAPVPTNKTATGIISSQSKCHIFINLFNFTTSNHTN